MRVRRAGPGDEPVLRALRLEALTDAPEAFGSTYARELARTTADWQRWLAPGVALILEEGGIPRGLVAGSPDRDDPAIVHLQAMWVHPLLRGTGAADALVAALLTWALDRSAHRIQLLVVASNERAQRLYARHGFRRTGHQATREKDGAIELRMEHPLVALERATPDMSRLVENLLELYIHDLSEIFAVELGADGRFGYAKLPLYWADSVGRYIFLIKYGGRVAGFAMATRGSPASECPTDLDVAEFFVLRAFRRSGIGRQAAFMLWNTIRGQWVVRVVETHETGVSFWSEVVRAYTSGRFAERSVTEAPDAWRVFTFESQ